MAKKKSTGARKHFSVDAEANRRMMNYKKEIDRRSPDSDASASEIIIKMDDERPKTREARAISVMSNYRDLLIPILVPLDRIQTKEKNRFEQLALVIDMTNDLILMGHDDAKLLRIINQGLQEIRDAIKDKVNGKKNGALDQYGKTK